jgi:NAD(P)H-dependent FMN reductase
MLGVAKVLIIIGSIRQQRICPQVAEWVAQIGRETLITTGNDDNTCAPSSARPIEFEIIDLKDWYLPMDDEPAIPASGEYACEHTRLWSRKVLEGGAFIFVTPQYNWGYPAALKNALDHLFKEWADKPAMIVTYGGHGGTKCAASLRQVLDGLDMKPVPTMPSFKLSRRFIEANIGSIDAAAEFESHLEVLKQGFTELVAMLNNTSAAVDAV